MHQKTHEEKYEWKLSSDYITNIINKLQINNEKKIHKRDVLIPAFETKTDI